jgi:MYXO-CTERM domain-containing protein
MTSTAVEPQTGRRHLTRELLTALLSIAAAGLITISVSGMLALALGEVAGKEFVAGDSASVVYADERCAVFIEHAPNAASCNDAATDYNFDRLVSNRISIGIVGLLALAGALLLRRRRKPEDVLALPTNLVPTVLTVIFSTVAFGLLAFSIMQLIYAGSSGIGADLAGGIVSAVAFLIAQRRSGRTFISFGRAEQDES